MSSRQHRSNGNADLSGVIATYLQAVDAGENPNPDEWIERHPDLADQLREFFVAQEQMKDLAEPLRDASVASNETTDGRPCDPATQSWLVVARWRSLRTCRTRPRRQGVPRQGEKGTIDQG